MSAAGRHLAQVMPLSEPALHKPAVIADSSDALMMSQVFRATSNARTAMPTIINRKVWIPSRQASRKTARAVRPPPASAAGGSAASSPPNATMANNTPLWAPVLKPSTSGLPRGLRSRD
ncbi:hypothetical protein FCN80_11425 [Martelella alba]|uniref:Uncharacterized protein n=1 Tax=Martelella alba TaxID=2590451 RepID=A0ABY2SQF2_9HYPH|nr:hypothetical protein FCN80_11425 [Martelella alba]